MKMILHILAPVVYILIVLFSFWLAVIHSKRRMDIGTLAAFFAGWVACAFSVVLVRLGQLDLPSIPSDLWAILISGVVGFVVGLGYLWAAKMVVGNTIMVSLFVLGSVGGSLISFYFYVIHSEIQIVFISSAVAYLFGVLIYVALFESRGSPGGIQAFNALRHRT